MKFPMRSLAVAAVLFSPAIVAAQDDDPARESLIRQAEMTCALAPELCEGAIEEINREIERDPNFEARGGPITYSDVVNAGASRPKPQPRRNTAPTPQRRPTSSGRRTTPTPISQPRPRPVPTAPTIPDSVAGLELDLIVTFSANRWQLDSKGKKDVQQLAASMKRLDSLGTPLTLRIEGHASRGKPGKAEAIEPWNLDLSKRRAETVKKALLKAGVKPEQIVSEGYGSSQPLKVEGIDPSDPVNQRVQAVRVK